MFPIELRSGAMKSRVWRRGLPRICLVSCVCCCSYQVECGLWCGVAGRGGRAFVYSPVCSFFWRFNVMVVL
ncbi:hypothetical protein HDK64DRAFT_67633 [Phyllosticta capitalensis]